MSNIPAPDNGHLTTGLSLLRSDLPSVEDLHPLREVARWLAPQRNGRPVNVATVFRWASKGVRGIVLPSWLVGHTRCSTRRAVNAWIVAISAPLPPTPENAAPHAMRPEQIAARGILRRAGIRRDEASSDGGVLPPDKDAGHGEGK